MGNLVGHLYVGQRGFDVLHGPTLDGGGFNGALVLVQQGNGVDQGEVLFMVAPGSRAIIQEGELVGPGVHYRQAAQQALGVAVGRQNGSLGLAFGQARQGAPFSLESVDAPGLLAVLVHRQDQAAIQ